MITPSRNTQEENRIVFQKQYEHDGHSSYLIVEGTLPLLTCYSRSTFLFYSSLIISWFVTSTLDQILVLSAFLQQLVMGTGVVARGQVRVSNRFRALYHFRALFRHIFWEAFKFHQNSPKSPDQRHHLNSNEYRYANHQSLVYFSAICILNCLMKVAVPI